MEYDFKKSVRIEKHTFKRGVNEVPEHIELHPHFETYVQAGWVGVAEKKAPKINNTFVERNKKLAEALRARQAAKVAPSVPEQKPPVEPSVEPEPEVGTELTPQQRAAITRKANAEAAKKAEEEEKAAK
jgi:hypothetical protein